MPLNLDPVSLLGIILSATIGIVALGVWFQSREKMPLFVSIGFWLFCGSFAIAGFESFPGQMGAVLISRMFGFISILLALFFYLGEVRKQNILLLERNECLKSEIAIRSKAEEAMKLSERQLTDIINFLPDATFAIDLSGNVIAWNHAIEEMTGIHSDQIIGKGNYEYSLPFYGKRCPVLIDLVLNEDQEAKKAYPSITKTGGKMISETYIPVLSGGKGAYLWLIASPLYDTNGTLIGAVESIRDITEWKESEDKNKRALAEKDVLLKEIHHRVKNNLQVISALIELQIHYMKDANSINTLRDSQNRIRTMAIIHETLYRAKDLARVEFPTYIKKLVDTLFDSYNVNDESISVVYRIEPIDLDVDTAIHCGLIINELVSNSFKHAFPDNREGKISIEFYQRDETYFLNYWDNGIGIPEGIDFETTESLGLKLVNLLVTEQLEGTISMIRDQGTRFNMTIPVRQGSTRKDQNKSG
ncbi:MAG TPA: histidine kinase dimerization/phosphoacceptor domain -containing protein [Methanoregulaceae archaeon]|nr:histidine kinase dimerization/phosphoacceptor domain -containing protein [Methanoregulaceae archaeon]